ncbi:hypothetical protein [Rhodococcus sp. 5G237]
MSDVEQIVRDLAAITAMEKLLADAKRTAKDALQSQLSRGTVYAFTGDQELGYASIPKPSQPKPQIQIVDEAETFAWMVDEFGEDVIETRVQLTEQGRKSLEARLQKGPVPGVTVVTPEPRPATPRFVPAKNVVELVRGMAERGELSFTTLLEIGDIK